MPVPDLCICLNVAEPSLHVTAVPGNAATPFTVAEPPGDGLLSLYVSWPYTPVAQFWTWVAGETELPLETIAANVLATFSEYNRPAAANVTNSVPLTKGDLRRLVKW